MDAYPKELIENPIPLLCLIGSEHVQNRIIKSLMKTSIKMGMKNEINHTSFSTVCLPSLFDDKELNKMFPTKKYFKKDIDPKLKENRVPNGILKVSKSTLSM